MKQLLVITFLFSALCISGCNKGKESGKKDSTQENIAEDRDCTNCGMPTEDYPKWSASLEKKDGNTLHFCSNRCMFMNLNEGENAKQIEQALVTDYYTLKKVSGTKAYFVSGSDIVGPMGKGFVAFESKEAAEEFTKDHNGNTVLSFDNVDMEAVKKAVGE